MRYLTGTITAMLLAATVPAAASARTAWFYERQLIPKGQTVEVASVAYPGKLKLKIRRPKLAAIEMSCGATGVEAVWNTTKGGRDETRSINFSCTSPSGRVVVTPFLPWTSILEGTVPPLVDQWNGVDLDVTVGGIDYGIFTGTLTPQMGDGDDAEAGARDDLDTELRFTGTDPRLTGPNGSTLSFAGFYHFGPSRGHGVTGGVV